jgi:hypothetical protein
MKRLNDDEISSCDNEEKPAKKDDFVQCQRALHKLMAASVVLDEQERQEKEGIQDHMLIAQQYMTFVERSRRSMFIATLLKQETSKKKKSTILREGFNM